MSSDSGDFPGRSGGHGRRPPAGSQGAARGGLRPDDAADDSSDRQSPGANSPYDSRGGTYDNPFGPGQSRGRSGGWGSPFGGGGRGGKTPTFLGLPVTLIYALGAAIIAIVIVGAVCGKPTATGSVAGQIKALNADRTVTTLAGAQIVVRGSNQTYTATSTDVPANADGEAAYNYRIENVPPGNYTMAVTPPSGSTLQPEQDISFKVESGQLFPQSVMLLAQGIQKPRPLAQNELQPGEAGGYINDQGQRITYQQGSGFDPTDALLLYLLWRNPPSYGYGYPPVIVSSPGGGTFGSGGSNYRVSDPPTTTRSGQTVTQRKPETPGQGATRPSSSTGATGSGPTYSSGSGSTGSSGSSTGSGSSSSGSSGSTQTRPSTSSGSGSTTTAPRAPSVPSQGASRPSSSSSSPSRSSAPSRSSGSSSGGRR